MGSMQLLSGVVSRHLPVLAAHHFIKHTSDKVPCHARPTPPCLQRAFQLYVGGVFDAECGTALDHGVLAVG